MHRRRSWLIFTLSLTLLGVSCARDWPVPMGKTVGGVVALEGAGPKACTLSAEVFERRAELAAQLGAGFPAWVEAALGIPAHSPGLAPLPEAELGRALDAVAWGQEAGLVILAGPCRPGLRVDRVVQPSGGGAAWELRLEVDPQPLPIAEISWRILPLLRGGTPALQILPDQRVLLTPGPEKLRLRATPQ